MKQLHTTHTTPRNGYTLLNGIHHIVLPSILETPPGRDAFAVLDVYPTCLALRGHDACMSLLLRFAAEGEGEEPGEAPAAPAALLPALAAALGDAAAAVAAGGCGKGAAAERQGAKVPVAARA